MSRRGVSAPSASVTVVTAAAFARKRRSVAVRLSLGGFALLMGGLFLNSPRTQIIAFVCLIAGTVLSWVGIAQMDRWVAVPRAEDALAEALADAGSIYTLYNWALPAEHVLVTPWGLVLLHPFNTDGPIAIDGAVWRDHRPVWRRLVSFGRRAVRNPRAFIDADVAALRAALAAADASLADVPISPVVVFTRRGMVLDTDRAAPDPPAVVAADLRTWLRETRRAQPALAPGDARRLQAVVAGMAEGQARDRGR